MINCHAFPLVVTVLGTLICVVAGTESQNGTTTTTFVTLQTLQTITYSFYGEGMVYDPAKDRFIFGSLQLGTLLSVPRSALLGSNVQYGAEDVTEILSQRPAAFNGSNFLGLEMDPVYKDVLWGCVSYGPNPTYGIARVNLSDSSVEFFDLGYLTNPSTGNHAVLNDLALSPDGAYVFITDTWGYQVLRLTIATGAAEVWSNGDVYCTDCLSTEPHFDGPNGIVYVSSSVNNACASNGPSATYNDDYLLIALGAGSRRLLKVNASFPFVEPVEVELQQNAGYIDGMDSIVMSRDTKTIFVAGNGVNSVFTLTSEDDWQAATVRATSNANCPLYQPSALVLVHDADIVCYCTNGFGPAPYPLTILPNAAGRVRADVGIQLSLLNMAGDGIEYDQGLKGRIIVGSTITGTIRGLPNTASQNVALSEADTFVYFRGGGDVPILSTKGMTIDIYNDCWLWVAVNSIPIGVAMFDICTAYNSSEPMLYIELSAFANPTVGSSPNDIAMFDNKLYVTDFKGGYVWEIVDPGMADRAISVYMELDPSQSRPNGIAVADNIMLVSLFDSDILLRVDLYTGKQATVTVTPPNVYVAGDGLRIADEGSILYVSRHNHDSVIALVSCDDWASAVVANDFFANCEASTEGSPVVTTLALADGDLWLFCSDNYGPGPYGFNRISNISGLVNSGSTVCIEATNTRENESSNSGDNDAYTSDPFLWTTVALVAVLCAGAVCIYNYFFSVIHRKGNFNSDRPLV